MATSNTVFLGCNYNDKKIKKQFDMLKKRIESDTALSCIVVDKRRGKPARDLWQDIRYYIEDAAACVFDLTSFRPNVVLELGYALSIKSEDQIFITFRKRKSRGSAPIWLLSDIGHLQRHEYVNVSELEHHIRTQLAYIAFSKGYEEFTSECSQTNAPEKYQQFGLRVLQHLRDEGSRTREQLQGVIAGSACRINRMINLLKDAGLIKRGVGRNGKISIA